MNARHRIRPRLRALVGAWVLYAPVATAQAQAPPALEPAPTATPVPAAAPTQANKAVSESALAPAVTAEPQAPLAPAPSAAPACVPGCRAGYECLGGQCVSSCNPLCSVFERCVPGGHCVPIVLPVAAPVMNANADEVERERIRAARMASRLAHRQVPRFTLHLMLGVSMLRTANGVEAQIPAVSAAIGYRQNLFEAFGVHARLSYGLGELRVEEYTFDTNPLGRTTETALTTTELDLVPYFGPFGRFFVGPMLSFGYADLAEPVWISQTPELVVKSGLRGGIGIDAGLLLGSKEQVELNCRYKAELFNEGYANLSIHCGVGLHLMESRPY